MIEIQNGCIRHPTKPKTWIYTYVEQSAHQSYQEPIEVKSTDYRIEFTAPSNVEPQIGDFIAGTVWIPRLTPKVNNDWSKWKGREL